MGLCVVMLQSNLHKTWTKSWKVYLSNMKNSSSNTASKLYCDTFKQILKHQVVQPFGTIIRDMQILCPLGHYRVCQCPDVCEEKVQLPSPGCTEGSLPSSQWNNIADHLKPVAHFLIFLGNFPTSFQFIKYSEENYRNIRSSFPKAQLKDLNLTHQ